MHIHKWSRWRTYTQVYIVQMAANRERTSYVKHQERTCSICGRLQDREV